MRRVDVRATAGVQRPAIVAAWMAGLAHDARVVSAAGEHKGHFGVGQQMDLVDRFPRCDMVGLGADDEPGRRHVFHRDRAAIDGVVPFGQGVAQVELAQVFAVHAIGHAGGVGIPGHEIVHRRALAHEVIAHQARPDQVGRAQHLEGAGHLGGVEIALRPHQVFEKTDLALIGKQGEFAGFGEVGLRREQADTGQTFITAPRQRCGCDGQQGAAQAVACGVHLAAGQDGSHRIERGKGAEVQIVIHAQIAFVRARVFPRQHEHRVALIDQKLHQRVVRRQVEDVVLHDPRRHDEHRLGQHRGRGRAVLDEFHQAVAQHHFARGRRQLVAGAKLLHPGGRAFVEHALGIVEPVAQALRQIGAAAAQGALQHFGVGPEKVAGREHVHPLTRHEGHHLLVMRRHAAHAVGGGIDELFAQQKALGQQVERKLLPLRRTEAPVVGGGGDAVGAGGAVGAQGVRAQFGGVAQPSPLHLQRLCGEAGLLAGRGRHVHAPVGKGQAERGGRQTERGLGRESVQRPVDQFAHGLLVVGRGERLRIGGRQRDASRCDCTQRASLNVGYGIGGGHGRRFGGLVHGLFHWQGRRGSCRGGSAQFARFAAWSWDLALRKLAGPP